MENHDFINSQFIVDDLLDFPSDDVMASEGMLNVGEGVHSGDSSTDLNTVVDSCNSSFSGDIAGRGFTDTHFSSDLCVPYDDMAELEWLSNFEEESFSSEDLQNLQIISGIKPRCKGEASQIQGDEDQNNSALFSPEVSVPGKARSKRSRIAPGNWTSRLLALTPGSVRLPQSDRPTSESESHPGTTGKKMVAGKKKDSDENSGGDGRRCLHCATDKTPQWRTGPMGPKTLCNACGVRYKSGRLVPEYRPAASPTFMSTKHSNSHRKVMELRRQKEVHRAHPHHHHHPHHFINNHGVMFDVPNGDDYNLIHQHIGPDFRQLI